MFRGENAGNFTWARQYKCLPYEDSELWREVLVSHQPPHTFRTLRCYQQMTSHESWRQYLICFLSTKSNVVRPMATTKFSDTTWTIEYYMKSLNTHLQWLLWLYFQVNTQTHDRKELQILISEECSLLYTVSSYLEKHGWIYRVHHHVICSSYHQAKLRVSSYALQKDISIV